jgi:hypothetical protein
MDPALIRGMTRPPEKPISQVMFEKKTGATLGAAPA